MPANLTPQYEKAEARYKAATTDEDRLDALREMFATIPKHKGTEKMQAELKRRISQFRKAIAHKPAGKGADLFHVPRAGAGQVVLVGPPNVGKSALVACATGAPLKVADYPFTTTLPAPGMAHFEDAQIMLVDTPPVTADHMPPGLMGTIRQCDVVAIVADASADPLGDAETVLSLLSARDLIPRTVSRHDLDPSTLSDHSGLIIATKADLATPDTIATLRELYAGRLEVFPVSATTGAGLPDLIHRLWALLSMIRVYTKTPGKPPDNQKPFTLEIGSTIDDLARAIHRDLPEKMKFARIWGNGRFAGQQVHRTEELRDKDLVEIHE